MNPWKRKEVIGECRVRDCGGNVYCKGYCERHYRRFSKYGDPLEGKTPKGTHLEFLRSIPETDNCVEWPFGIQDTGYGRLRFQGKMINAHRAALIIHCGPPPTPELHAAHQPAVCHNRACVNPRHLRWASPAENMADKTIDGTTFFPRGERQGAAKLRSRDVLAIRQSDKTQNELAAIYGVSKQQISRIIRRERWQHV